MTCTDPASLHFKSRVYPEDRVHEVWVLGAALQDLINQAPGAALTPQIHALAWDMGITFMWTIPNDLKRSLEAKWIMALDDLIENPVTADLVQVPQGFLRTQFPADGDIYEAHRCIPFWVGNARTTPLAEDAAEALKMGLTYIEQVLVMELMSAVPERRSLAALMRKRLVFWTAEVRTMLAGEPCRLKIVPYRTESVRLTMRQARD